MHLSLRLRCTIVIIRCPSSVVVNFSHFRLLLLKPLYKIQRNIRGSNTLTSSTKFVFFRANRKNKMTVLASDWLRHFVLLLWNHWTEFNAIWYQARSQHYLPSLCFSGWSDNHDSHPCLWSAENFSTSPLKLLHRFQWNLTGSKIFDILYQDFVFWADRKKTRWPPWPRIGWDISDFSSETA